MDHHPVRWYGTARLSDDAEDAMTEEQGRLEAARKEDFLGECNAQAAGAVGRFGSRAGEGEGDGIGRCDRRNDGGNRRVRVTIVPLSCRRRTETPAKLERRQLCIVRSFSRGSWSVHSSRCPAVPVWIRRE
ncbi:protein of unknown function [Nitrospira japonica]|uniref:Uncharacterized protein n=1 Tax=Nitrospira japonica TaxID=1325564 RepID=A0A1W1I0W3_9BACT|nr:protein of unknown function [Nitrospira japonica]